MHPLFESSEFAEKLGLSIRKKELFQEAITHRSYLNEHRDYPLPHNERLEFLGDAVLELSVTEYLYNKFPKKPEGELTALRAALVNGEMLAKIAREMKIESYLLMSRGEAKDTGRARAYLLANAIEAIIGAIYVDQGYKPADAFIQENILSHLDEVVSDELYADAKSRFQELSQEKMGLTPTYQVLKEWGPDHDRHFVAGVFLGEEKAAEGEGLSKQEAQRDAAKNALSAKGW